MDKEKMIVITADIEDDVDPGQKQAAINRELNAEGWFDLKITSQIKEPVWTRNFVPVLIFIFWSLFAGAQYCEGKEPHVYINTSCHEVCVPHTYKPDSEACMNFMMKAMGATDYTWTVQGQTVALTDTLYYWPPATPGVTNYVVTGAVYYFGRPCFGTAVISITAVACSLTLNLPTGIDEAEDPALVPVYFDLYGNRTDKRSNTVLIEQAGLKRRKVIIQH